jgi:hypothetical protein
MRLYSRYLLNFSQICTLSKLGLFGNEETAAQSRDAEEIDATYDALTCQVHELHHLAILLQKG